MGSPEDIADAVAQDADRFGLVLAAADHARDVANGLIKRQAPPIGARCAAALRDVALDPDLRQEAWRRLIETRRSTGEIDAPSETELMDEDSLLKLLSTTMDSDDLAA
ncbi:MAG: hypothetical protein ACPGID_08845 [Rubricella sp.]